MKKAMPVILSALVLIALVACGATETETASEEQTPQVSENAIPVENAFYFTHVDGHRKEQEMVAFVLFEYEQLRTVKYQVAYIMCTCRQPEVNYWSVAYVELNKSDGSIVDISYEADGTDHYVAGLYGDSFESWDGTPVRELFDGFIDETLMGASQEEILAFEPMHGAVDTYAGATVTPNNAIRMLHGLFGYHNRKYS
jgi:hypothetical protein